MANQPFKFDMLFEIQVPRPWTEGKERRKFQECMEQAVFAEKMGFETVWVVEHHFLSEFAHSSAPEVLLSAIAQKTSRMRIGHGVVLLPAAVNHPIRVAERAAMLDIVSDGRLEMGTGRSSSPYQITPFGTDMMTTREQWEESIRLLPQLWTKENFSYEGRFWKWQEKITVVPKPVQKPHPRLWVAGAQPDSARLAAERGLGALLPALNKPEALLPAVQAYKRAIVAPTAPVGEFVNNQCALFALSFCSEDDDKARVVGGMAAKWYIDTIQEIYKDDYVGTPLESVPDSLKYYAAAKQAGRLASGTVGMALPKKGVDDQMKYVNDAADSGAFLVGDPAHVIANIRKYQATGADRLICVFQMADIPHEDIMRSIELFGTKVMPAISGVPAAESR